MKHEYFNISGISESDAYQTSTLAQYCIICSQPVNDFNNPKSCKTKSFGFPNILKIMTPLNHELLFKNMKKVYFA